MDRTKKCIRQTDGLTTAPSLYGIPHRAAHPLFTVHRTGACKRHGEKSFIAFYEQNGRLPVWNFYGSETDMMIGDHAVPVIADAYLKGIGDFDAEKALKLV